MKDDRLYLHHMLERCHRITRFTGRDVLIHDYIGVDLEEVWNVASVRIPELQAVLEQFLAKRAS